MVSRAFNPASSVRGEMREKILAKAAELGYAPDKTARAMVTGRSDLVAIVVPTLANPWEAQEIDRLCAALQPLALTPVLYRIPGDQADAASLIRVQDYRPAIVVAFMDKIDPDDLLPLFGNSPAIYPCFGTVPPQVGAQTVDLLKVEHRDGIRNAVRLLRGTGRRRVVYVGGTRHATSEIDRYAAFRAAMEAEGLEQGSRLEGNFDYDTARAQVNRFISGGGTADAFLAANDVSAFGVMDALRFDLGRRIPEDHAVIGFDDIDQANWRAYDLTTVANPLDKRVAAITRLIEGRLNAPDAAAQSETVTARLVVRSST